MKKLLILNTVLFILTPLSFAQNETTLDDALKEAALYFTERLPSGTRIAISNFNAPLTGISEYIIDDMIKYLIESRKFSIVDRQYLSKARDEISLNVSGEVNDETAQKIGRFVGAQIILYGAIKPVGKIYRLQARAIKVETAEIQEVYTCNIKTNDITRMFAFPFPHDKPPLAFSFNFIVDYYTEMFFGNKIIYGFLPLGFDAGIKMKPTRGCSWLLFADLALGLSIDDVSNEPNKYSAENYPELGLQYRIGGIAAAQSGNLITGAGGGMKYNMENADYPYLRGSVSYLFLENLMRAGVTVDYNFNNSFEAGFLFGIGLYGN
jgi:tetrahydromethanopterin S-methyltransferase subunit G